MSLALSLARNGLGLTSPNPMVGCVIVKDGQVIGTGWHHQYGHPHAEIEAINDAHSRGHDVRGSTVYVTLEPCSHYGKTPPCANRLVDEGVGHVVVAMRDPNPKVNGRGISILREAGVTVTELEGEITESAKFLNRGFVFVHKYGRPFVSLKAAMSLDGRMNLANGSSKWITGIEARTEAHRMRAENDAVLVGAGTVLADDPELTVRLVDGVNTLRVVVDSRLRTPTSAKVIGTDGKCIILTTEHADGNKAKSLLNAGAGIMAVPSKDGHVDLRQALGFLVERGILTLMAEGGPEILGAFLREGLADYVRIFTASAKIFGEGRGLDVGAGFRDVGGAFTLTGTRTRILGGDIMTEGRLSCSPGL